MSNYKHFKYNNVWPIFVTVVTFLFFLGATYNRLDTLDRSFSNYQKDRSEADKQMYAELNDVKKNVNFIADRVDALSARLPSVKGVATSSAMPRLPIATPTTKK